MICTPSLALPLHHRPIQKTGDLSECVNAFEVHIDGFMRDHQTKQKQTRDTRRSNERKNRDNYIVWMDKSKLMSYCYYFINYPRQCPLNITH